MPLGALVAGVLWMGSSFAAALYAVSFYRKRSDLFAVKFDTAEFLFFGGCEFLLAVSVAVICALSAVGVFSGRVRSLTPLAVSSLVFTLIIVIVLAQHEFLISYNVSSYLGLGSESLWDAFRLAAKLLVWQSGVIVASVLALLVNSRYRAWYLSKRARQQSAPA